MVVWTQRDRVTRARAGVLEFLLLNHPLDCPICDSAGQCALQDRAFDCGVTATRSREPRRALEKRVPLSPTLMLDREHCILCRRCVSFCHHISGSGELGIFERGDRSLVDVFPGREVDDPYSMNLVDLCPTGAITSRDARSDVRPWDLRAIPSVCGGCARGCNVYLDVADGRVQRCRPRRNDAVNQSWMCDYGRRSFTAVERPDRLARAQVRGEDGALHAVPLDEALAEAARRLRALADAKGAGVIAGVASPHASNEDLLCFWRLLEELGTESAGVAVRRGESDEILICAERAANAAGALMLGFVDARPLVERIQGGGVDGLLVSGHELLDESYLGDAALLGKLDSVILLDTHQSPLLRVAHVVLPVRHLAEKEGLVTNAEGRVQRLRRAVEARPGVLDEGELLYRLARELGLEGFDVEYSLDAVSASLADSLNERASG